MSCAWCTGSHTVWSHTTRRNSAAYEYSYPSRKKGKAHPTTRLAELSTIAAQLRVVFVYPSARTR